MKVWSRDHQRSAGVYVAFLPLSSRIVAHSCRRLYIACAYCAFQHVTANVRSVSARGMNRKRLIVTTVCAVVAFAGMGWLQLRNARASVASDSQPSGFHGLLNWVVTSGKPSVIRANVAAVLGLGDKDKAVIERGFRRSGDSPTHVFAVIADDLDVVSSAILGVLDESTGAGTFWHASRDGILVRTVVIDTRGTVSVVANETAADVYAGEKEVFRRAMLRELGDDFTGERTREAP